ncbi:MAG: hypothetical protein JW966_03720 [Anaerolineae bacterium]|nr:hypothetical protein [Anaerolineae bacterium]
MIRKQHAILVIILILLISTAALPVNLFSTGTGSQTAYAQANQIQYGTSLIGTINAQIPMGIYLFNGNSGDLVTVHVASTDRAMNPSINIVGPSQQSAGHSDNAPFMPVKTDAYLSIFLPETGTFSILVGSADGASGDYLLRLDGRGPVQRTPLPFGVPVDVTIPVRPQPQYFEFEASPLCVTTLIVTDLSEGHPLTFPFTAEVRDQRGTSIAMLQGGRALNDTVTVMSGSGLYEVEVGSADIATSGRIQLLVTCADDLPVCDYPADDLWFPLDPPAPREPICGNGIVENDELCDPPNGVTCSDICQGMLVTVEPACGNGILEGDEMCDPPDGVTCSTVCTPMAIQRVSCGNGVVEPDLGEACDPPDGVTCDYACHWIPTQQSHCGNGVVEPDLGEQCDPPDGAACSAACTFLQGRLYCGDGVVSPENGEECDPPDGATCSENCTLFQQLLYCGDGVVSPEGGEQCDPPDDTTCDQQCQTIFQGEPMYVDQPCGDGVIDQTIGEECEPPGTDTCDVECQLRAFCGNGIIDPGEECEPPGTQLCDANCMEIGQQPVCGNGVVEEGEECELPNTDTCDAGCQLRPYCGDGNVDPGEQCDPPNGSDCDDNCLWAVY